MQSSQLGFRFLQTVAPKSTNPRLYVLTSFESSGSISIRLLSTADLLLDFTFETTDKGGELEIQIGE
jgi:hypothetical protein